MTAPTLRLGRADVRAAAERIADHIRPTPLLPCQPGLRLKAEHQQRGGSFKFRGAANALLGTPATAVVTGSSGNHGIAVATLGARLGIPVTVVMAEAASQAKAAKIRDLGATVVAVPGGVAARERHARDLAARTGAFLLPSSDHDLVVAGAGTVTLEILTDAPDTAALFVPTGGGGLLAGACLAALDHPVRVIGVEPAACRRYARSLAAGHPVELPPPDTVADGLRGQRPGEVPFPIIQHRVDDLVAVSDEDINHALDLLRRNGVNAEPSGAVAFAGALRAGWHADTVAIVSGGNTTPKGLP
ncbi:pyridoxal-phosphate dependent enzyme [Crossiella sp. SN42]|uniref:threonine ammonia-lyase n=1 Tax=Crossiella sp. SN42 TaxID=2944808 RepID=UPI00207D5851|nr:pyridoxal-phosphate dependent enzyme [Crossiella sp. SN42]MCO1578416.1 pyridoxal-phosphate dependent enzyme [Crossiella sp. SN42]